MSQVDLYFTEGDRLQGIELASSKEKLGFDLCGSSVFLVLNVLSFAKK